MIARAVVRRVQIALCQDVAHQKIARERSNDAVGVAPVAALLQREDHPIALCVGWG